MATIQRRARKNGGQSYRVQVRQRGQALSATFASLAEARDWAAAIESGIQREYAAAESVTLGELIRRYQCEVLPRKKSRTQTNQALHLAWWAHALGPRPMVDVTPSRLAVCRDELACTRSAGTVNQYLRTLSHVLSVSVREWSLIEVNPLRRVQYLQEPRGRVWFLDDAERQRLLAAGIPVRRDSSYHQSLSANQLALAWPG